MLQNQISLEGQKQKSHIAISLPMQDTKTQSCAIMPAIHQRRQQTQFAIFSCVNPY